MENQIVKQVIFVVFGAFYLLALVVAGVALAYYSSI